MNNLLNLKIMKQILDNKRIDYWLQIIAIVAPMIGALVMMNLAVIFLIYFTLGAVQYLSCIFNRLFLPEKIRNTSRTAYEVILLSLTLLGTIMWLIDNEVFFLLPILLLFASPLLALWYLYMTASEIDLVKEVLRRVKQDRLAKVEQEEPVFE